MRDQFFLYEQGEGGGATGQIPIPAQGAAGGAAPVSGGAPAASAPAQGGSADSGWTSVRDAFKDYGFDLSGFQDDQQALGHIAGLVKQFQSVYPQWQQVQGQLPAFYAWQQEQQKAAEQKKAEGKWAWKAPNYDPSWAYQITRDPQTGNMVPAPGAPPDIVSRYHAGQREFADQLHSFFKDPLGAIGPGVQELIQPLIEKAISEKLAQTQAQSYADTFLQQHANWLFNTDPNTKAPVLDPITQRPTLSAPGQQFYRHLQDAAQMGIADQANQQKYALNMLRAELASSQQAQQGQQARQQFLQSGSPPPLPPAGQATPPAPRGLKLQNRMMDAFKANGLAGSDLVR